MRLKNYGIVLKKLENVESANQSWFEEAKSHLTIKEQEVNDFNKSNKQNSNKSSKIVTIFRDSSKKISKLFKKLQINSNDDEKEITQQQIKGQNINVDDEDEVYNNPNFHSKEQYELEIPDDGF
ncbi:unnamed protein product [Rhizophagus irregularis]|nr:unnamed protein product [Rhizophagus irregularis]